ncbi:putative inactive purple acid phosphatase 9 [Thelohanellus kitauei]|uniref:Purple acid phosphatase n=1 Tax=Thelohanellus kitauei TaxID=669202 RepID=A0A0C2JJ49_THEKT|nr:putative inactive purple acid phosphatase 9 [Thelohanellus kitauei]
MALSRFVAFFSILRVIYAIGNTSEMYMDIDDPPVPILVVEYPDDLQNGGFVKVRWSGIPKPSLTDQIGLYCPIELENSRILRRYKHFNYPEIGNANGELTIRIFYPRASCQFRYLKQKKEGHKIKLKVIAKSNEVKFNMNKETPTQIHIALTGNPDQLRVSWVSGSNLEPCVWYGKSFERLDNKKCGTSETYQAKDMCEPIATTRGFIDPGFMHSVVLTDLDNDQLYYYAVGSSEFLSPLFRTKSSLKSEPGNSREIAVAVVGDVDVTPFPAAYGTISNMMKYMENSLLDIALHVGDISYAMGMGYTWEEFGYLIQPVASEIPYMMTIGNHEHNHLHHHERDPSKDGPLFRPVLKTYVHDSGGECGIPMYYRYKMPENGNSLFWYSYDYGLVHFVSISSENNFTEGSNQYRWLEQDLAKVNRALKPWVIVSIHRSLYISAPPQHYDEATDVLRQHLEKLLIKYNVNFVLSGHYHSYERTCPVNKFFFILTSGECVKGPLTRNDWGIVHLTVGTGGRELDQPLSTYNSWCMARLFVYGVGYLKIKNEHEASWKFIGNENNIVLDEMFYYFDLSYP